MTYSSCLLGHCTKLCASEAPKPWLGRSVAARASKDQAAAEETMSTTRTWNPTRGCSAISPGCENCCAARQAARPVLSGPGKPYEGLVRVGKQGPRWTGKVVLDAETLGEPLGWKKPRRVFVNDMSDLFHEALADEQIAAVFGVMAACPQHTFQLLTKRAERMAAWFEWITARRSTIAEALGGHIGKTWTIANRLFDLAEKSAPRLPLPEDRPWPLPNVSIGVSVEDQQRADERIPYLLRVPAVVRFVCVEPLLGPVDLTTVDQGASCDLLNALDGAWRNRAFGSRPYRERDARVDWTIIGGESGPGARPMDPAWARSIVEQCDAKRRVPVSVERASESVK